MPAKTLREIFSTVLPWESSQVSWYSDSGHKGIMLGFLDGLTGLFIYYGTDNWTFHLSDGVTVRRRPEVWVHKLPM